MEWLIKISFIFVGMWFLMYFILCLICFFNEYIEYDVFFEIKNEYKMIIFDFE